jgi:hypothetical protein
MRKHRLFLYALFASQFLLVRQALPQDTTLPTVEQILPAAGTSVAQLGQIEVLFDEDVTGVDASDLLINGVPATDLEFGIPGQFTFKFPQPPTGTVQVAWAPVHGIQDLASNDFGGGVWSYTLNPALAFFDVRINEFMADNENGIRDEDGTHQDWIELYNAGSTAVNLGGWSLTDDPLNLNKWRLPPTVQLGPNGYLLVWASGKDRTNIAALHTNFKLDKGGDFLALVLPDGITTVSSFSPSYPPQQTDVSYGRDRLDPNIVGFYSTPTPNAPNAVSGPTGFTADVIYSVPSGTFTTPFDLTLSTASANAVIHYVLVTNAMTASALATNVPTTNSPIYTGPIRVELTTEVRARAFEPGLLPSTPKTESYILISPNVLSFSSDLPVCVLHALGASTVPSTWLSGLIMTFGDGLERSSLTNAPQLATRMGFHIRGSSTLNQAKSNFRMEFWDEFNQDDHHPFLGMPSESDWVFYGINGFDPGLMHNAIYHWLGKQIGVPYMRTRYVEVFRKVGPGPVTTNDYFGLYLVEESPKISKDRLDLATLSDQDTNAPAITGGYLLKIDRADGATERSFTPPTIGSIRPTPAAIVYWDPGYRPVESDPRRLAQINYLQSYILNFITNLSSANYTDPVTGYAKYINPEQWIDHLIANIVPFNVDGYRLSGYFYKDRNGRLEQGPQWDCDRCLGTGGTTTPQSDNRCFSPRYWRLPASDVGTDNGTDFFGVSNVGVSWFTPLFRDPEFWQKFIDRYQAFRTNEYATNAIYAVIDGFYEEIKEAQVREQAKWGTTANSFTWPRSGVQSVNGYTFDFGPADNFGRGRFTNEVNFQKKWLVDRFNFMDTNFLSMPILPLGTASVTPGSSVTVIPASEANTLLLYTLDGTDPRLPGGAVAPNIKTNTGTLTLTITNNVRLFARCYNTNHFNMTNSGSQVGKPLINSYWSGPVAATYYVSVPPLRITELMYHPANPPAGNTNDADNFEYIEVKNIGATPLNVNRFRIRGGVDFDFPNQLLAPGQYAVIVRDAAAFQSRYGAGPLILGSYSNNLANDGDHLVLEGSLREPILDFNYRDDWYPITDGPGFSLVNTNENGTLDSWSLKSSWRPSGSVNGSPGAADAAPPTLAAVYINEALTHTDPSPGDAIELYNSTGAAVNIGGWFLTDSFNSPKKYRIPDGTMISANGYVVFYESNSFGTGSNSFALSSKGDAVYVFSGDGAGNLTGWVHGFDFGAQANGVTFGRYVISTGEDHFPVQTTPTLGAANSGPKVGPVVISEINYNPPDLHYPLARVDNTLDEYIELHNISGATAHLYDDANPSNTFRLRDAVSFSFPQGASIAANGYILVVSFDPSDPSALQRFLSANPVTPGTPIFGPWDGKLDNTEDSVELARPDLPDPPGTPTAGFVPYILVERVRYKNTLPWPVGANGLGASISRLNDSAYGNDPANWRAAVKTPGAPTPVGGTPPTVTMQPVNAVGIETKSVMFSVSATGTAPLGYQWTFNEQTIDGAINPVLMLNNLTPNDAGVYACYVLNPAGTTVSSNATLTVLRVAVINQQPITAYPRIRPDPLALDPTNATFTVVASSTTPISYQWKYNGTNIPGATSSTLVVSNVTLAKAGTYTADITDSVATISTTNSMLIPLITPVVTQPPLSLTVATGALVGVSVTLGDGNPPPFYYEWRRASTVIGAFSLMEKSSFFTFRAPATIGTQAYRLIITNLATTNVQAVAPTFSVTTVADSDGDGIPDGYEAAIGLNTNNAADALADLDGDGMTNLAEYLAGTDPIDPNSYLRIDQTTTPGVTKLQLGAISNRTYSVQFAPQLPGPWSRLADIPARTTNHVETIQDPIGAGNRFYRIVLPAPSP